MAQLIERYSARREHDLEKLIRIIVFTTLIGNADAHGKNVAFLHPEPGSIELAPLYDTVPTVMWPTLRREAAMTIGGVEVLGDVDVDDVASEVGTWTSRVPTAREIAVAAAGEIVENAQRVELSKDLGDFISRRASQFIV